MCQGWIADRIPSPVFQFLHTPIDVTKCLSSPLRLLKGGGRQTKSLSMVCAQVYRMFPERCGPVLRLTHRPGARPARDGPSITTSLSTFDRPDVSRARLLHTAYQSVQWELDVRPRPKPSLVRQDAADRKRPPAQDVSPLTHRKLPLASPSLLLELTDTWKAAAKAKAINASVSSPRSFPLAKPRLGRSKTQPNLLQGLSEGDMPTD